jgi:non-heme chloroperoxidase
MDRRDVLRTAVAAAGTGSLLAAYATALARADSSATPRRASRTSVSTRDGVALRLRDWGQGQPVVLMSGWGLSSDFWHYALIDLVSKGYRCVAYDRRGHGRSDEPGSGYDYDTLADDLAAVLTALDLKDVTLVAYSMSGGEAVRYVTRHSAARIERLVLLSALTPFLTQTPDNPGGVPTAAFDAMRGQMAADFPKWIAAGEDAYWREFATAGLREWGRSMMYQSSVPALVQCHRAMAETDFREEMAKLSLPTLVIHGDKDASAPLPITGARSAALVPNARLSVYEGAPHGLPITHRGRLIEELVGFVGAPTRT